MEALVKKGLRRKLALGALGALVLGVVGCFVSFDEFPLGTSETGGGGSSGTSMGAGDAVLVGTFTSDAVAGSKNGVTLRGQISGMRPFTARRTASASTDRSGKQS